MAASNNRDHEITLVVIINKYYQLLTRFTSIYIRGNSPRSLHRITLLLLVCAAYIWVLFFTHIPFVVNRTMNATPTERLQHHFRHWHAYKRKVWQILQAWRNRSTFPSQLIALKSKLKLKFCHTVPSPREGAFVGLVVPPKQSFKPPQLKYKAL